MTLIISLRIIDPAEQGKDPQRYNRPTIDEVTVIIPIREASTYIQEITLKRRSDGVFKRIPHTSQIYIPMIYLLLFIYGKDGWFLNIPIANKVTYLN